MSAADHTRLAASVPATRMQAQRSGGDPGACLSDASAISITTHPGRKHQHQLTIGGLGCNRRCRISERAAPDRPPSSILMPPPIPRPPSPPPPSANYPDEDEP